MARTEAAGERQRGKGREHRVSEGGQGSRGAADDEGGDGHVDAGESTTTAATVRPAVVADADEIAVAHVRAWQAAYRGLMPAEYLDGLSVADRARGWAQALGAQRDHAVVVAVVEDRVVGFAGFGPSRDAESRGLGELYAINLHPDVWARGAGSVLIRHVESALRAAGHEEAILWVVPTNSRARRFYEARGWRCDAMERSATVHGVTVDEIRYSRVLHEGPGPPADP